MFSDDDDDVDDASICDDNVVREFNSVMNQTNLTCRT